MKRGTARRAFAATLAATQLALLVVTVGRAPAAAAGVCAPGAGKDGAGGALGLVNTYYAPANGTTLTAGQATTQITLPAPDTTGGGASTPAVPAVNDELLIIQMQDGTINTTNSAAYGTVTTLGNAGLYEYVYVSAVAGSVVTVKGAGANGGLLNGYVEAAATGASGQRTFQVVRVPQYTTATLSANFHAAYWDGKTGGVAALDMASTLNLGGASIYATGDGFRGGGFTVANSSAAGVLNSDWVDSAAMNGASPPGQGSKAEGVFGTPGNLFYYGTFTTPSAPSGAAVIASTTNGYPGGDMAKGAPGNAGGGGSDIDPAANDQNTGGGGGANGGNGGNGGYPWTSSYTGSTPNYAIDSPGAHSAAGFAPANGTTNNPDIGGRGGTSLTPSITRVFMGGGGGAGSNNNNSNDANNTYGTYGSSGGVGGGIVMLRVADTSGAAATIYANGTTGLAPANDGGGGGGAGGTVIVTSPAAFSGITVNVDGAAGTTAARLASGAGISYQHGPGGGGGGGVALSSSPVTASANGGAAGLTVTDVQANDTYGATAGTGGTIGSVSAAQVPGVLSGAECYVSGGPLYNGPSGADQTVGSYDGSVPVTNNNDFTQVAFNPAGASYINSGVVAGTWIGNTIAQGPTTVNVINQFEYFNAAAAKNVTFTITAPTSPAGWTARICPDNGLGTAPSCATTANWTTVGAAGSASSSIYHVPINTPASVKYWAVYSAPAGLTAFARYDAPIYATVGAVSNATHNELYPGFLVQTKTATYTPNCGGRAIPANGVCPGGTIAYTIDYRNVAVPTTGGDNEPAAAFAQANGITLTDDGTATPAGAAQTQNWALPAGGNGYVKAAATTTGSGAPTVTYYWSQPSLGSSTTFPATTPQKTSVYKLTVTGVSLTAGQNAQVTFTVQF